MQDSGHYGGSPSKHHRRTRIECERRQRRDFSHRNHKFGSFFRKARRLLLAISGMIASDKSHFIHGCA